jgi:hypothetical protein
MKPADREILSRTEAAAPLNFEIVKLDHVGWGSAYPEGFAIDVSEPLNKFSLPLVCDVTLTSDTKSSVNEPEQNGVRVWLKMTVGTDRSLSYSDFKVKLGPLSPDAAKKVAAQAVSTPLVDTDMGKALLFPGLSTNDGQFTVGWTVQAARKGEPPVEGAHWDPTDPDKLLRLYDWQPSRVPSFGTPVSKKSSTHNSQSSDLLEGRFSSAFVRVSRASHSLVSWGLSHLSLEEMSLYLPDASLKRIHQKGERVRLYLLAMFFSAVELTKIRQQTLSFYSEKS